MPDVWRFPAAVDDVVDGDTLDVTVDLGFRVYSQTRIRLRGIDTAEIYGVDQDSAEYMLGIDHAQFVESFVAAADDREYPFLLETDTESGKYGRWIGDLKRLSDDVWLTDALDDEYPDVDRGY